jgi:hypothetical protein
MSTDQSHDPNQHIKFENKDVGLPEEDDLPAFKDQYANAQEIQSMVQLEAELKVTNCLIIS